VWRFACLGTLLFCTPACSLILGIDDFRLTDATMPVVDALPDAALCYGAGLAHFCLSSLPTTAVTLDAATLDTSATGCQAVAQSGGPEMCVVAGSQITVPVSAIVIVTGSRPLVLVAAQSISIQGTLDLSSKRTPLRIGAGGNAALCAANTPPANSTAGGGGGAGGTFGSRGANGGLGNGGATGRGTSAAVEPVTLVHGGCAGSDGGDSPGQGGAGGGGGGAVYMIAGQQITISGSVYASGAGAGATALYAGGGGGGSGGLVGLESPTIMVSGIVSANGGGGSAGASGATVGGPGVDGTTATFTTVAPGGTGGGGAGGHGSAGMIAPLAGASGAATTGGGGGGGGFGIIWVKGGFTGTQVSPEPTQM
jgi:hypothetical protein